MKNYFRKLIEAHELIRKITKNEKGNCEYLGSYNYARNCKNYELLSPSNIDWFLSRTKRQYTYNFKDSL